MVPLRNPGTKERTILTKQEILQPNDNFYIQLFPLL
jgi:hypothetical protein